MLLSLVYAGCLTCSEKLELDLTCKVSYGSATGLSETYYTYVDVQVTNHHKKMTVKSHDKQQEVELDFRIKTNKKGATLTLSSSFQNASGRKSVNSNSVKVISEESYALDSDLLLDGYFNVLCANSMDNVYSEPETKLTCTSQVDNGKRVIKVHTFSLENPNLQVRMLEGQHSSSVVMNKDEHSAYISLSSNDAKDQADLATIHQYWNHWYLEHLLQVTYRVEEQEYKFKCTQYKQGDEKPDLDLNLSCRIRDYQTGYHSSQILNGGFVNFRAYYMSIDAFISKKNGYSLVLHDQLYAQEDEYALNIVNNQLELEEDLIYDYSYYSGHGSTSVYYILHCKSTTISEKRFKELESSTDLNRKKKEYFTAANLASTAIIAKANALYGNDANKWNSM